MRKQKRSLLFLASLAILIVIAGGGCNSTATIHDISAAGAYALIQENKDNADFEVIDIRTPDEYAAGHLENAKLIDYYDQSFSQEISKLDRNKRYLIYCRTGNRSGEAREIFRSLAFKDVWNMEGGITAWQEAGYQLVK